MVRGSSELLYGGKGPPEQYRTCAVRDPKQLSFESLEKSAPTFNQTSSECKHSNAQRNPSPVTTGTVPLLELCVYEDGNSHWTCGRYLHPKCEEALAQKLHDIREILESPGTQDVEELDPTSDDELGENGEEQSWWLEPTSRRPTSVAEKAVLYHWYWKNFEQQQQLFCKDIAKRWIKIIHPKKQGRHPYNGGKLARDKGLSKKSKERGLLTIPPWWPEDVPHTEPDHLDKWGRIKLLMHILTGMFQSDCGPDGSRRLNVEILRESTKHAREELEGLKNGKRAYALLCKLYYVREKEEQFLSDGCGPNTKVTLEFWPPPAHSRRLGPSGYEGRPRKERKLSCAPDLLLQDPMNETHRQHDLSPSETGNDYDANAVIELGPEIKQESPDHPEPCKINPYVNDTAVQFPPAALDIATNGLHQKELAALASEAPPANVQLQEMSMEHPGSAPPIYSPDIPRHPPMIPQDWYEGLGGREEQRFVGTWASQGGHPHGGGMVTRSHGSGDANENYLRSAMECNPGASHLAFQHPQPGYVAPGSRDGLHPQPYLQGYYNGEFVTTGIGSVVQPRD